MKLILIYKFFDRAELIILHFVNFFIHKYLFINSDSYLSNIQEQIIIEQLKYLINITGRFLLAYYVTF